MGWFPEKNDPELERLAELVNDLRRRIFSHEEYHHAHERVWEAPEEEARREKWNEEALHEWDAETCQLIRGEPARDDPE